MRKRCLWPAALLAPALVAATMIFVGPALAATGEEARVLALTNQARASAGAPVLAFDEGIAAVSRAWARNMAAAGGISHNPSYTSQITGWSMVGENVGMGGSVDIVHHALMASPGHYANLVNADFAVVGIGVVSAGTTVYVVQNFVRPASSAVRAPARAPASASAETPAPRRPATTAPPRRSPPPTPAPPPPGPPAAPPPAPEAVPEPQPQSASPALTFVLDSLRAFDQSVHRGR